MRGQPPEPRLAVDEAVSNASDCTVRIDLVLTDVVTGPLELDGAEQELGRAVARSRRIEAREPAREVDERDPHDRPRLPPQALRPSTTLHAVHRQRTKLASRVNRVASSLERRGIVATYEAHDRFLGNRRARRRFSSHVPSLDDLQQSLVEALDRDGYVSLPFADLVGKDVWRAVDGQGAAFIAETERTIAEGGRGKVRLGKEFVQRAYSFEGATHGADNPWFAACSSRRLIDIANAYLESWRLGLKAVAVYRDGCKRSQPLSTSKEPLEAKAGDAPEPRPARRKLPDERRSITHKVSIAGHEGYITVGMYEDGTPGEIFLVMAKEGSTISGLMDAFATSISMALQYGVPLEALVEKFSHVRFEPSGFTKNPEIPFAKSITDYIFRWLAAKFLSPEDAQAVVDQINGQPSTSANLALDDVMPSEIIAVAAELQPLDGFTRYLVDVDDAARAEPLSTPGWIIRLQELPQAPEGSPGLSVLPAVGTGEVAIALQIEGAQVTRLVVVGSVPDIRIDL